MTAVINLSADKVFRLKKEADDLRATIPATREHEVKRAKLDAISRLLDAVLMHGEQAIDSRIEYYNKRRQQNENIQELPTGSQDALPDMRNVGGQELHTRGSQRDERRRVTYVQSSTRAHRLHRATAVLGLPAEETDASNGVPREARVLGSIWFDRTGIVLYHNGHELKAYIGQGFGMSQERDEAYITKWGRPFPLAEAISLIGVDVQ